MQSEETCQDISENNSLRQAGKHSFFPVFLEDENPPLRTSGLGTGLHLCRTLGSWDGWVMHEMRVILQRIS